ncbi:MAG: type II toxin-antitoxin system VapC family toxin [Coriobacteriia bacterium]|nr:type II toxin-antitoxin system VapC family toxin [Coriobacteriia bacterium]
MSGRPLVVDTSVALKWLKPQGERHVEAALVLLDEHQSGASVLHAPGHLLLEVMNALWSHHASAEQIERAIELLRKLHIVFVEPDDRLLASAATLAVEHRITAYDAVFAALAGSLGCELVTDDRTLAAAGACKIRALA